EPYAVNPLRAVIRLPKLVPAKLLGRGGCVCSQKRIPLKVSLGAVDTLARIRKKATPPQQTVASSIITGELLARIPSNKLIKQTGWEDRPV
ncbi:hypothetical protein HAX54_052668, partial [Datura stramonium]|nr:hypothetical protein [Datura stramonium]